MQIIGLINRLRDRTQTESESKARMRGTDEIIASRKPGVTLLKNLTFLLPIMKGRRLKSKFLTVQTVTFKANKIYIKTVQFEPFKNLRNQFELSQIAT